MANERIKENAKATPGGVAKVVASAAPVHEQKIPQKIYVGPNLLGLPKYTVVESIKTPHIQLFIKDCAAIEKLFVPIEKMAEVESRIVQKGTLEHRDYNKAIEFKIGKGDQ